MNVAANDHSTTFTQVEVGKHRDSRGGDEETGANVLGRRGREWHRTDRVDTADRMSPRSIDRKGGSV